MVLRRRTRLLPYVLAFLLSLSLHHENNVLVTANEPCNVCGENGVMEAGEQALHQNQPCSFWQDLGERGVFDPTSCEGIQNSDIFTNCNCRIVTPPPTPGTETPSTSPSVMPSSSPTTPFTLVSPQNSDDVTNPELTFEWTLVWNPADINRVVYHIEYKDETTRVWTRLYRGKLPVQDDGVYEDTQNLVDLGGPSAFAEYKWRILVDAKPRTGFPSIKTDWVLFDLVQ